ncbi:MAG: hypothetical protein IKG98_04955 [Ruminococcus sp.]|nr:hypothetical protein [Ruminococcus sp.]MBR5165382.1 hypothetical protein [Ruminococcus sp.]
MENIAMLSAVTAGIKMAYLDPSSTTLIIQIVAGVVITVGTVLGIYWRKMKNAVKKKKPEDEAPAAEMKGAEDGKDVITADDLLDDEDDE